MYKRLSLLFALTCLFCFGAKAQNTKEGNVSNPCAEVLPDGDIITTNGNDIIMEPGYKGGEEKLYKFLSENLQYPDDALKNGITGTVVLKFVVEKNGTLTGITVSQSVCPTIDEECIRVMNKMPRWKPGTVNGKPARFSYCLPFRFELN